MGIEVGNCNEQARVSHLEVYAKDMGLTVLSNFVDTSFLPSHLPQGFANRAWPEYRLEERIVERAYIPPVPAVHSQEAWTLEIEHDRLIRIDGRASRVYGPRILSLLNIFLLCRDVSLEYRDFCALGFATELRDGREKKSNFQFLRHSLERRCQPYELFVAKNRFEQGRHRINPAMRIMDRREFS